MNISPFSSPKTISDLDHDNNNKKKHHAINIKDSSKPNTCNHAVEGQLLSLSVTPKNTPSPNSHGRHSSSHHSHYQRHGSDTSDKIRLQSEALRKTFDDLDEESLYSRSQDTSIIQESIITRSSTPMSNVCNIFLFPFFFG